MVAYVVQLGLEEGRGGVITNRWSFFRIILLIFLIRHLYDIIIIIIIMTSS